MTSSLLPTNSTPWERALADAMTMPEVVHDSIGAMRRVKYVSPRPAMLPFLVYEYGLGELTPYVPNLYDLIDQGVRWQRVRGTVSAVAIGLAWIGYSADIEPAWTGRRWWNSFQLRFPTLPVADSPDLERIEGITGLSVPKRSQLRRGVHQYDVGPLEADQTLLDGSMLDHESGIAVTPAGTIWSFGRTHEFAHTLTKAEGLAIDNWIATSGAAILWVDLDIPWITADFAWTDDPEYQRRAIMASWFAQRTAYLVLRDIDDVVIGYRRCRAVRVVVPILDGAYQIGGETVHPSSGGHLVYVEALTQFGDADGVHCASIALLFGGVVADGVPEGRLWLEPEQLSGGAEIAAVPVDIGLRASVRDQFKILIDFVPPPSDPAAVYANNWFWL